jgi:acyl-CoA reductase-like NAD-dependent aldehyde dehydrogenase
VKTQQLIDGRWGDAIDGGRYDVIDPGTEEIVANVPYGNGADVVAAVDAAHRAFAAWRARTPYDRGAILRAAADLMRARAQELATTTVRESGKPLGDAVREWQIAADLFEFFAEEGKRVHGRTIPSRVATKRMMVLHEPIGVVGVITAWNFPVYNPARAVAAALGAGCTVVMRGAELTPLSGMAMAAILEEAGVPNGVMNVVNGEPQAMGQAMLDHPDLRKLSFTGSVPVGKLLMDGASRTMTRLSLELGGNAPVLVLPDADVEAIAKQSVAARFRNAGQVCISPQRFFVEKARLATFLDVAVEEAKKLPVGPGLDPASRVGPLISARHRERVEALIASTKSAGARVLTGGKRPERRGFFLEPAVLGDVTQDMPAFAEETFGPILAVTSFDRLDDAIAGANRTRHGLAAYVFTNDLAAAMHTYERLDFGMIGVNEWAPHATEAPFAGRKDSGVGHESGREGLYDNLETKLVSVGNVR